jgi:hypothetical protein
MKYRKITKNSKHPKQLTDGDFHWDYLVNVNGEIRKLIPILLQLRKTNSLSCAKTICCVKIATGKNEISVAFVVM